MSKMTEAEFSSLAGKLPWYVIEDYDDVQAFREAAIAARGDIDAMPEPWRSIMLENRDIDLTDFDAPIESAFGFDVPDPLFVDTFREMGKA